MERVNTSAGQNATTSISRTGMHGTSFRRTKSAHQSRLGRNPRRHIRQRKRNGRAYEQLRRRNVAHRAVQPAVERRSAACRPNHLRRSIRRTSVQIVVPGDGTIARRLASGLCPHCAIAFDGTRCKACGLTISNSKGDR